MSPDTGLRMSVDAVQNFSIKEMAFSTLSDSIYPHWLSSGVKLDGILEYDGVGNGGR